MIPNVLEHTRFIECCQLLDANNVKYELFYGTDSVVITFEYEEYFKGKDLLEALLESKGEDPNERQYPDRGVFNFELYSQEPKRYLDEF